jgi:hypothetical protein
MSMTKVTTIRNGASDAVTPNNGAASQTILYDRADEAFVIRVTSTDAATATVTIKANGTGGGGVDTSFTVAQNQTKYIGALESMKYKSGSTGRVTMTITNANGTAYSGTVTNVKFEVIGLPKSGTN